ncbi:hypothetical protein DY000_02053211 [Brassica cretica]|uniref:Uncharacterized protein n=1 Tax=Brassica cretica TaxID=69181 RepID=A0ABQ7ALT9_BRACR|nr:hypothetical protein DY000_02053211 [Brassica cretica]
MSVRISLFSCSVGFISLDTPIALSGSISRFKGLDLATPLCPPHWEEPVTTSFNTSAYARITRRTPSVRIEENVRHHAMAPEKEDTTSTTNPFLDDPNDHHRKHPIRLK